MKHTMIVGLAGACAPLIAPSPAHANFIGLSLSSQFATGGRIAYRVYALFSNPNDYLTGVSGSPTLGNLIILSRNLTNTGPGSNFFNPPGGGATAPSQTAINSSAEIADDTFVTIGVSISNQAPGGVDQTGLSPGFTGIGTVNQINTNNAGWFTPGPVEQGRAGFTGDGDQLLRVLMMQLTVTSTSQVFVDAAISGFNNTPNGLVSFTVPHAGFIPEPAMVAVMFGWLFLPGRRRRIMQ
jgi:hypothetical protein